MSTTYYQQDGQNKRLWVRQGDTRPYAEVQLILSSDGSYEDISSGKGFIEVYSYGTSTTIISGNALNLASGGAMGKARMDWTPGQLVTKGTYKLIFRIDKDNSDNYFSIPEEPYEYILRVI